MIRATCRNPPSISGDRFHRPPCLCFTPAACWTSTFLFLVLNAALRLLTPLLSFQIKAFEKMDHLARAQRILELQEAENARLEIAQKHPDIYAVPVKLPKPNLNRPQPIGSIAEPQAASRPGYSEPRGGEDRAEYRRQLSDQTRKGYYNPQKYTDTEL
ncbi:tight junction protein ZO-2-like [Fundulus heteroclitus]|uniref:tight junction protein ZO-2-like n=1 Tax=Fundulus heteroclitus TaxID=8078 RepID=UPI00165CAC4D|nr:tight junction protein ZO-2-like [Fundulus heteroclitus]